VLVSLEIEAGALTVPHEVFDPSVVRYLPELLVWLGAKALKAVLAVVCPVPPATIGRVPAVKAEELVEYRALLAPVKVVRPVPPAAEGRVPAVSVVDPVEYRALLAPTKVVRPVPPYGG
jgi:hypothetical protein